MDLSVVMPTLNERDNISILIPHLRSALSPLVSQYEIIVVDGGSSDGTTQLAAELADRVVLQSRPGYGLALREGFAVAQGQYVATLDADLSHEPSFLAAMYQARATADIIIASRYADGGAGHMPLSRTVLSRILNLAYRRALSLPIRDMSSGFRLYNAKVLRELKVEGLGFDALPEIVVRCLAAGWQVRELPFHYPQRQHGHSTAKLVRLGLAYLSTLSHMWRLRNSIDSADYDDRAFDSRIPFQRYWQRKRHTIITQAVPGCTATLDIGCGSSRIFHELPSATGLDIKLNKLRYMRKYGKQVVNGTIFALPFPDESFGCVICSQVIEHVSHDVRIFTEMRRVLTDGGTLIIGTPDYGSRLWRLIEVIYQRVIPGGYADEHITHYTRTSLEDHLQRHRFRLEQTSSVLGAELILRLRKVP